MLIEVGAEVDVDNENDADLDDACDEYESTKWTKADISLVVENLKNLNRNPNGKNNAAHAREAALLGYFWLPRIRKIKKAASSFILDAAGAYFSRSIRKWDGMFMKTSLCLSRNKEKRQAIKSFFRTRTVSLSCRNTSVQISSISKLQPWKNTRMKKFSPS